MTDSPNPTHPAHPTEGPTDGVEAAQADATTGPGVADRPVVPSSPDFRIEPGFDQPERELLVAFLDYQRGTLLRKVAGLTPAQLVVRATPPSALSPLGIVRHLTEVDRFWLSEVLLGHDLPDLYCAIDDQDGDFDNGTVDSAPMDVAAWITEVERAKRNVAEWPDLDQPSVGTRAGRHVTLRWILVHLVEEYARHNGHLDLLREAIDGATGE